MPARLFFMLFKSSDAQRFALPASGRAGTLLRSRKNSKPENCLKMRQNPTCLVHALLGAVYEHKTHWLLKNLLANVSTGSTTTRLYFTRNFDIGNNVATDEQLPRNFDLQKTILYFDSFNNRPREIDQLKRLETLLKESTAMVQIFRI